MRSSSPYVLVALGLAAVAVIGYAILGERGTATVARAGAAAPSPVGALLTGAPADASAIPAVDAGTSTIPAVGQPTPSSSPSSPAPAPLTSVASLPSWIFANGAGALRAGFGNVYTTATGLAVTGPYGALNLKNPDVIFASANDALRNGAGSIYQQGGKYYVAGPAGAVRLTDKYEPHTATFDTSAYGAVTGVVRGWTLLTDRSGNTSAVPAHTVQGSTYAGDAVGTAPTSSEWAALQSLRGSLPVGQRA